MELTILQELHLKFFFLITFSKELRESFFVTFSSLILNYLVQLYYRLLLNIILRLFQLSFFIEILIQINTLVLTFVSVFFHIPAIILNVW